MSSPSDYNYSQSAASATDSLSLQLPFALLSTAIAIILVAQTVGTFKTRSALHEGESQLQDFYRNRQGLVKQADDVQQQLQTLALDLLLLSKTDDDAKAIIQKYNIQQAAGAATPAPAPAPAPEPAK